MRIERIDQSLGERLIFNPNGGAVAFFGSTTLTVPVAQVALARAFFDRLGQETSLPPHDVRLGDLALQAKTILGAGPSTADTLKSYTLLGDPSMRLPASAFADPVAAGYNSRFSRSSNDDEGRDHGSFLACGTTSAGGGSGPGPGAFAELALLLGMIMVSHRFSRRKPANSHA